MILLAVPLGLGAGAIGVALNNYVALHYSAVVRFARAKFGHVYFPVVHHLCVRSDGSYHRLGTKVVEEKESLRLRLLFI